MKILLINSNPVVSRLLVLCTRDDSMTLEEVLSIDGIHDSYYDIVFVDEASYTHDSLEFLDGLNILKKVFISYKKNTMEGFDTTIKKPFLPSQIIELIDSIEDHEVKGEALEDDFISPLDSDRKREDDDLPTIFPLEEDMEETETEDYFNPSVLDGNEIERIKTLLEMDEEIIVPDIDNLNEEEYEKRKVEVIKEHLLADGIEEILREEEIVSSLSDLPDEINLKKKKNKLKQKAKSKKEKKKKDLQFTEEEIMQVEDAVEKVMIKMKKKEMKKLLKGESIELHIRLKGEK